MGRSAGNDSGRSFFVWPPPWGGYRDSRGSWPEDSVPSGKWWGMAEAIGGSSSDGLQGVGTELAQGVKAAPGEFSGDRQRRARVREPALLERQVVGPVGARRTAGRLG